jgi:hypothetical protein
MRMRVLLLAGGLLAGACAPRRAASPAVSPAPAAGAHFAVLGNASPSDTGAPTLRLDSQVVTIRGLALQVEGGGLYGDVDLSEPHTVRLTLYDSIPGRPVADPPPPSPHSRQVIYEARIGPLAPGPYDVWVGRFDPRGRLVEVSHEPLRIEVKRAPVAARAAGSDTAGAGPD